jgi:hypothetical protein
LILRGVFLYPECPTLKLENPIFREIFFPGSGLIISKGKKSKFSQDNAVKNKFIFAKTFFL